MWQHYVWKVSAKGHEVDRRVARTVAARLRPAGLEPARRRISRMSVVSDAFYSCKGSASRSSVYYASDREFYSDESEDAKDQVRI